MTREQIVKLAIENNLVPEVYDLLHHLVIRRLGILQDESDKLNAELRLVKKFADVNKIGAIKDILAESDE